MISAFCIVSCMPAAFAMHFCMHCSHLPFSLWERGLQVAFLQHDKGLHNHVFIDGIPLAFVQPVFRFSYSLCLILACVTFQLLSFYSLSYSRLCPVLAYAVLASFFLDCFSVKLFQPLSNSYCNVNYLILGFLKIVSIGICWSSAVNLAGFFSRFCVACSQL